MPRLSPKLLLRAQKTHRLLPLTLRATRDWDSARNELRWLTQHVYKDATKSGRQLLNPWIELRRLCQKRSCGIPLQYLLGFEYFGDLEIACKPGVLIPRWETAASVIYLAEILAAHNFTVPLHKLQVLDLCTGTGCIPLLFTHEFQKHDTVQNVSLRCLGVDISEKAIDLAKSNRDTLTDQCFHEDEELPDVNFVRANVLAEQNAKHIDPVPALSEVLSEAADNGAGPRWDVLISNPPYISPKDFNSTTSRSVRRYEPRLALVPEQMKSGQNIDSGDVFYPRLLETALQVNARVVLFEVADLLQARRVAKMVLAQGIWRGVEIWRDQPTHSRNANHVLEADVELNEVMVRGVGHGRSVYAWRI